MLDILQTLMLLGMSGYLFMQRKPLTIRKSEKKVILDSCALIDGRILDLSRMGFVPGELIVPAFILDELQMLADGSDAQKRERARYGLDVIKQLQERGKAPLVISEVQIPGRHTVDEKLVLLAQRLKADLYTTDYNLNKVADIKGVLVLNVNELAGALRPIALPGEKRDVKIMQKGSGQSQGVGYLEDGTMVVVEKAARLVGKTVPTEVTRIHQTVAGKMIFADLVMPTKSPVKPAAKPQDRAATLRKRLRTR